MNHLRWVFIFLYCLVSTGCSSINYYIQSISGQMEVLLKREDMLEVISHPDTDEKLRQKLVTAKSILEFAHQELSLPDNGSYQHYSDLKRPYLVWNVIATPELSMESKKWCYLFLGCLSYRGFFKESAAKAYAKILEYDGFEVYVGGVSAYSTLGWLKDPVINTMLNREDWELARLIFHELAHQLFYASDDTDFNEAFADAVSRIGLEKWLQAQSPETRLSVQEIIHQEDIFIKIIMDYREKLVNLYATGQSENDMTENKAQILNSLKLTLQSRMQDWSSKSRYQTWLDGDVNNARLAIVSTYRSLLPEFMSLYDETGRNLSHFYSISKEASKCSAVQRRKYLDMKSNRISPCEGL